METCVSEYWKKKVHMTQVCEKSLFQHLVTAGNFYIIKPDGDNSFLCAENIRTLELIRKPRHCVQFLQVLKLDQSLKFLL